ncbi:MAG TPA: SDR family oxidoreductase [Solirubrobacteraceae bacterium]|jgi:uncharacterized protein YbjT (DUF2867 family)
MDVAIAGGHGRVALRLAALLAARGDRVRAIVRNPEHVADVEAVGAGAVLCDLEREEARGIAKHVAGADAVVFAAGAGPGSGPERKRTVDLGAALKLIGAAERAAVRRYVMVSSIGAHDPDGAGNAMRPYLQAKAEADAALVASGLDYTIVRPGSLGDDAGTGRVALSTDLGGRGPIPRDDVAAVLLACLDAPETIGVTFEAFAGDQEIDLAVRALARGTS